MMQKPAPIVGQRKATSFTVITSNLEFNSGVTRTAYTNLDMLQECRTDDHWNVGVDRNLSDSRTGFMKFTILNEKPPKGYMWSGSG